jgi:hypothetical protein
MISLRVARVVVLAQIVDHLTWKTSASGDMHLKGEKNVG